MSRLQKYAQKSDLMNISIILDSGERFKFNLFEELQISEDRLNYEAMDQPSSYAFLGMLHNKLISVVEDRKMAMDKAWSAAYVAAKQDTNPDTGRPYSDDMAKAMASVSKEYLDSYSEYLQSKFKASILGTCVNSFEHRVSLIQTISANNRKV